MIMRRSVGSGVSSSGAAVSKLTAEREMEGFVAGMHASKRLNTVKRNHLLRYARSRVTHRSSDPSDDMHGR
jgi:hypothetical protein